MQTIFQDLPRKGNPPRRIFGLVCRKQSIWQYNNVKAGNLFNPSWVFNLNRTRQLKNFCLKWNSVISVERFEAKEERELLPTLLKTYIGLF